MSNIPFQTINWELIEKIEHKGETGVAFWQTIQFDGLRIRLVEYSSGYLSDHWCQKVILYIAWTEISIANLALVKK